MFFALSKILLPFTYPLSWILILLILAYFLRKKRIAKKLIIASIAVFLFFSNSFILNQVLKTWEGRNDSFEKEVYDGVIILGGYSNWNSRHNMVSFSESSDRFIRGFELYKKGIAKKIILTGGSGLLLKQEEKESYWINKMLLDFGVNEGDIIIEGESRNTHENATFTQEILPEGDYILLTSAFHMRRAEKCFEKVDFNCHPYRVDFLVDDEDYTLEVYFIPSAMALTAWQILIKEWLGYAVYWMKGYL